MRNVFYLEITVLGQTMSLYHVFVLQSSKLVFGIFHITDNSMPLSSLLEDGFSYRKVKHLSEFTMSKIFQSYMQIFFIK